MSLFGAMTTAISGLSAQSKALGYVSNNLANSQTVGYKRVDATFQDMLTQSNQIVHAPGSVIARPDYTNTLQGPIEQVENNLSLAIGGQGFFSVTASRGQGSDGQQIFDDRQMFTRAGDFTMDRQGYLRNGSGYYLQGWPVSTAGGVDRTTLQPIQVTQSVFTPLPTTSVELSANIPALSPPATPADARSFSTQVQVYDNLGKRHALTLNFAQTPGTPGPSNSWDLTVTPNPTSGPISIPIVFGSDGTIQSFNGVASPVGTAITEVLNMNFGQGPQNITLNLGSFGVPVGLTQYAGNDFTLRDMRQDGVPPGAYSGIAIRENGDVAVNYDNGQSRVISRIPLVGFSDADRLQRLDGQAFMRTIDSGEARITDVSVNGVGKLVVGAVERSNVDIANEFTKLIVAQRAYSANTKVVTSSDELLQETINMKR